MLSFAGSPPASAAPLVWPEGSYSYVIVDQDIREVLEEFGKNLGVKVQVSDEVKGHLRGDWPELQPRQFLETMAQHIGFDWYFDGHVLHITATTESQTRLLFLGRVPFSQLRRDLADLAILESRFPLRFSPGSNLALVAGPPRYLEMVEETLAALNSRSSAETVVFRGRGGPGS